MEVGGPASERGDCYVRRQAGAPVAVLAAATCVTLAQPLLSARLLRIDDDRLLALQLGSGADRADSLGCARRDGRWQCGDRALTAAAQRALFAALHALQLGARPTYAAAPAARPRFTLDLTHAPLGSATLHPSFLGPAAAVGEDVAPAAQTLRLYAAPDGGLLARIDQRGVTYALPGTALAALQEALAPTHP